MVSLPCCFTCLSPSLRHRVELSLAYYQEAALTGRRFSVICSESHKETLQDVSDCLFTMGAISSNSGGGALWSEL